MAPRRRWTVLIVAAIAGMVVVLGIGVAVGIRIGGDSGSGGVAPSPVAAPRTYSMDRVTNACDSVDASPLTKWSAVPKGEPEHAETRPSVYGAGGLRCVVGYTSSTESLNKAGMRVEAEFTSGAAPPFYDHWQHSDVVTTGARSASGEVTGIGAQGYWHSEIEGDLVTRTTYVVCVRDANVSVRVALNLNREQGALPMVSDAELDAIARAQVRRTLDALAE
ncbi:hypothetical protein [Nocardia wallacei]|uniref:hypothetical protein n=1 Tax=Nocardia wallacei TaxID=480035 RepID=UPI0024554913|nr:hypothetical protein [Nocardia wallacei]